MTPIVAEMIRNLWPNRYDSETRTQIRRCVQIARNHVNVRGYEVPGRDNSRDLRLQELAK